MYLYLRFSRKLLFQKCSAGRQTLGAFLFTPLTSCINQLYFLLLFLGFNGRFSKAMQSS